MIGQPEVVAADLKQLSEAGLQVLRVFPLWPDFQPITQLYGPGGIRKEIRHSEEPLNSPAEPQLANSISLATDCGSNSFAIRHAS